MLINNQDDARVILANMNHNDMLKYGYQTVSKFQNGEVEPARFNTSCEVLGGPKRYNLTLSEATEYLLKDKDYFNSHENLVIGNYHAFVRS